MANVIIRNRLGQTITVSTDNGSGAQPLVLNPHGSSAPVDENHVTDYTKNIERRGHIDIVKA